LRIFNREIVDESEPLPMLVNKLMADPEAKNRAYGCNLQHDPRVSGEREEHFLKVLSPASTPAKRLENFVNGYVQRTTAPDFLNAHNGENLVDNPPDELVTIQNINGLVFFMSKWARDAGIVGFATYSLVFDEQKVAVHDKMQPAKRKAFLSELFQWHVDYSKAVPYNPVWLGCANELIPCRSAPEVERGRRLCERVGVATNKKDGEWVVTLTFASNQLKPIYRPTCLDGATEYHCPSPEGAKAHDGGIAVDLNASDAMPLVAREYIAKYPELIAASYDADHDCFLLDGAPTRPLPEVRKDHLRRLMAIFKEPDATAWIFRVEKSVH